MERERWREMPNDLEFPRPVNKRFRPGGRKRRSRRRSSKYSDWSRLYIFRLYLSFRPLRGRKQKKFGAGPTLSIAPLLPIFLRPQPPRPSSSSSSSSQVFIYEISTRRNRKKKRENLQHKTMKFQKNIYLFEMGGGGREGGRGRGKMS